MNHVDTTSPITHISLCAGYGGIDLGLKRAIPNLRTIAFSEIEAFACANLVSKMEAGLLDAAPIWTNLKTLPWGKFRGVVDILSGGYPCQPFSAAGKRLGTEDPRHLWPYIADGIAAMRPSVCFFENVEGHISLGLPDVIEDLGRLGYRTTWGIFSASEVGAPHQRKRVFIMAHREGFRIQGHGADWIKESLPYAREGIPMCGGVSMADALCNGSGEGREVRQGPDGAIPISNGESRGTWPSRPGQPQFSWEPPRVVANTGSLGRGGRSDGDEGGMRGEIQTTGSCGALGNASKQGLEGSIQQSGLSEGRSKRPDEDLGNATTPRRSQHCAGLNQSQDNPSATNRDEDQRQTQPSLGGDPHGPSCGVGHALLQEPDHADFGAGSECGGKLDDARLLGSEVNEQQAAGVEQSSELDDTRGTELHGVSDRSNREEVASIRESGTPDLYTSCDNRTDELRLLGNGVVPATAELAFRTLWEELTWK